MDNVVEVVELLRQQTALENQIMNTGVSFNKPVHSRQQTASDFN